MIRKIFTIWSFALATCFVVALFITATTLTQLAFAVVLYPLLVYVAYRAFLDQRLESRIKLAVENNSINPLKESLEVNDDDRRVFLKLVGSTGIFLFIYSLLNISRKPTSMLPKEWLKFGGQQLHSPVPSDQEHVQGQKTADQLMEGFKIAEIDNADISYYGFIATNGAWYIMQAKTEEGSFRYVRGEAGFPANWANRKKLKYDYLDKVF